MLAHDVRNLLLFTTLHRTDQYIDHFSNAGGHTITEFSKQVYKSGKPRETIKLPDMEQTAWTLASHEKGTDLLLHFTNNHCNSDVGL